jgi:hypothetical protein
MSLPKNRRRRMIIQTAQSIQTTRISTRLSSPTIKVTNTSKHNLPRPINAKVIVHKLKICIKNRTNNTKKINQTRKTKTKRTNKTSRSSRTKDQLIRVAGVLCHQANADFLLPLRVFNNKSHSPWLTRKQNNPRLIWTLLSMWRILDLTILHSHFNFRIPHLYLEMGKRVKLSSNLNLAALSPYGRTIKLTVSRSQSKSQIVWRRDKWVVRSDPASRQLLVSVL